MRGNFGISSRQDIFIQTAGFEHAEITADILADSFQNDPIITWVSSDPTYRKFVFTLSLPLFLQHGHVYFTADRQGAALWLPPGILMNPPITMGLVWTYFRRYGIGSIRRSFSLLTQMKKSHPVARHYYLFAIGVRPEARRRGIGSALIRHVLSRCDSEQIPAYLENTNPRNIPFYLLHGFEVLQELTPTAGGPKLWTMLRQPRSNNTT